MPTKNRRFRINSLATFIFFMICFNIFSEENINSNVNSITAISILGLNRTKSYIVETPLQKFLGRKAEDVDINEVYAIIKDTGILEPETVEIVDNQDKNGKVLKIRVREKWSFFPLPFFAFGSSDWSVGGAVMDANAFGIKDNMMLMGIYGSSSWMTGLMYSHNTNAVGDLGWRINAMFSSKEMESVDQTEEQILRRFKMLTLNPSFGLSYSLTESITPGFDISYKEIILKDNKEALNAPKEGIQAITISPTISIRHTSWDGYFLSGKSASLKYNHTFTIGEDDIQSISFNGRFDHSIASGLQLISRSGVVFSSSSASPFFETSPTSASVNILPQKYSTCNIAGVSIGLEQYIYDFSFGLLSLSTSYQAVYSDSELLNNQFDHGLYGLLQLYFSGIAIPGVGLGVSYNVDKDFLQYSFNIGMSF